MDAMPMNPEPRPDGLGWQNGPFRPRSCQRLHLPTVKASSRMKITEVRLTGLAGGTVEGGWVDDLKPEDDIHTIVEVLTDEGLVGIGAAYTSKALTEAAVKLLKPLLIGE